MEEHSIDLACEPGAALAAARRAASDWGGELVPEAGGAGEPRRLRLPVTYGLRQGIVGGELAVSPLPQGARLSLRVDTEEFQLRLVAIGLLLLGGAGGLILILWPFYPRLLGLAPLGLVLAVATWFLVLSRLRVSGPQEFLEAVAAITGEIGEIGETRETGETGKVNGEQSKPGDGS